MFHSVYYLVIYEFSAFMKIKSNICYCYSLSGIQSDSEESTNYHTINHTFDVTDGPELCSEDEDSSDYTQTHLEASSMFYTPKHQLSSSASAGEEHSQVKLHWDLILSK